MVTREWCVDLQMRGGWATSTPSILTMSPWSTNCRTAILSGKLQSQSAREQTLVTRDCAIYLSSPIPTFAPQSCFRQNSTMRSKSHTTAAARHSTLLNRSGLRQSCDLLFRTLWTLFRHPLEFSLQRATTTALRRTALITVFSSKHQMPNIACARLVTMTNYFTEVEVGVCVCVCICMYVYCVCMYLYIYIYIICVCVRACRGQYISRSSFSFPIVLNSHVLLSTIIRQVLGNFFFERKGPIKLIDACEGFSCSAQCPN